MHKFFTLLFILFLFSCNGAGDSFPMGKTGEDHAFPEFENKKYDVKSGLIVFETVMNTRSVDIVYKTIIYFDQYGMVERRDTYDKNKLQETFLSDGVNNYNISHNLKTAVRTGKAYRGTESKFGWDEISAEDVKSGKIVKQPQMVIAGKKCKVYDVKTGVATATFAGWKNIILMNQIKSAGGVSTMKAQTIKIVPINPVIFKVPQGYTIKG